ncbi:hypothetical protein [Cellulosilyticum sp. I15G10I2]|uniref:hypothetical protein n=1 Tax=Cellulosilyticum sp. I15G10I2 TaxID=1892843 RepID=UPI00085BE9EB|nr:hypothetical protein [Cellulosilyticum sp. I15G10I2]
MNTVNLCDLEDVGTIAEHITKAEDYIKEIKQDKKMYSTEYSDLIQTIEDWIPALRQYINHDDYICGFYMDEGSYVICEPYHVCPEDGDGDLIIVEWQM